MTTLALILNSQRSCHNEESVLKDDGELYVYPESVLKAPHTSSHPGLIRHHPRDFARAQSGGNQPENGIMSSTPESHCLIKRAQHDCLNPKP